MLEIAILKNFDGGTYKAGVQLAGSLTTYFDDISVAKNIPSSALVIGNYVILAIPGGNPRDACVIATWPHGSPGGGAFLDLSDTPSSYSGQAGKLVMVNAGENALEFKKIDVYTVVGTNITYTIGSGQDYATIHDATEDLTSLIMEADITLKLVSDVTETSMVNIRGIIGTKGVLRIELNGYTWNLNVDEVYQVFIWGQPLVCIQTQDNAGGTVKLLRANMTFAPRDTSFIRIGWQSNRPVTIDMNNLNPTRFWTLSDRSEVWFRYFSFTNVPASPTNILTLWAHSKVSMESAVPTPWSILAGSMVIDQNGDIWTSKGKVT